MLLSAVSLLVVAQSSSEIPEGLTNNPVRLEVLLKLPFAEWMRFHVRAQFRTILYVANKIHRHVCYAQGRDDVNLLDLNQLTQLICL